MRSVLRNGVRRPPLPRAPVSSVAQKRGPSSFVRSLHSLLVGCWSLTIGRFVPEGRQRVEKRRFQRSAIRGPPSARKTARRSQLELLRRLDRLLPSTVNDPHQQTQLFVAYRAVGIDTGGAEGLQPHREEAKNTYSVVQTKWQAAFPIARFGCGPPWRAHGCAQTHGLRAPSCTRASSSLNLGKIKMIIKRPYSEAG